MLKLYSLRAAPLNGILEQLGRISKVQFYLDAREVCLDGFHAEMHSLSYPGGFIPLANPAKDLKFMVSKVVYRSSKMFAFFAFFIASH